MKYLCIHGHFYQPPRENAWLEAIELQDSAAPYHDWNQRICAECYSPNALARVLNEKKELTDNLTVKEIVKLYALIERALIYDWCLCGGEYSLSTHAKTVLPMLLSQIRL